MSRAECHSLEWLPCSMPAMLLDLPNHARGVSMSNDARMLVGERSY